MLRNLVLFFMIKKILRFKNGSKNYLAVLRTTSGKEFTAANVEGFSLFSVKVWTKMPDCHDKSLNVNTLLHIPYSSIEYIGDVPV